MPSRLKDGTLVSLHAQGRPFAEMETEGPEQPVFLRTSGDSGRTWSEPRRVFAYEAGRGTVVHQVYTLVDRENHIHAFSVRYYSLPKKADRSSGHSELLHNVSRDGGTTWSPPRKADFGHSYTGAINSIIQLADGRLLGALSYTSNDFVEKVGQIEFRSVSFYSDDDGDTWRMGTDNLRVPLGPQVAHPGAIEPILLQLRDGRVWMLIRTQTLRFWETFSTDGGRTFPAPKVTRFMAPDSPGAILKLSDGRVLFVWNDIASYPNGVSGHWRQYLYAAISSDEGRTWSPSKRVGPLVEPDLPGSRGDYPFLCETPEKSVLLYYTRFGLKEDANYVNQHNELVRIDANWVSGR